MFCVGLNCNAFYGVNSVENALKIGSQPRNARNCEEEKGDILGCHGHLAR